jgi:hypothetical protein
MSSARSRMHELSQAGQLVPLHLRCVFLKEWPPKLREKQLGDGLVHHVAYDV